MNWYKLQKFEFLDTAGWIATTSLLLCALSGALLAIPYDFNRAYQSVFELLLFDNFGSFIRNFHYWSAQLLFISVLVHLYDHLSKSTETNIKSKRIWFIMSLALIVLGYEMLSGFILKGDAAGLQARRILTSMLESFPLIGNMLSSAFAGTEDHWLVVYVQHIATGTIFLLIAIYEHVKRIWPKLKTFLVVSIVLILVSIFFRAPLGLAESNQLKGPWFFVGIQEMLHWISHPRYVVIILLGTIVLLYFLPQFSSLGRKYIKRVMLALGILYFLVTLLVLIFRGENWQWKNMKENTSSNEPMIIFDPLNLLHEKVRISIPENQKPESCLLCHGKMKGLSDSHNPKIMGCVACHKGDPFSSDKTRSHRNMIKVPGNLSNVLQTCGTQDCHQEIAGRMLQSLMTTQSGIVAVDKFVFQETKSLDDTFHIKNLGYTAGDTHLRNLCAGCHLGNEKVKTGNAAWLERGGGCNACHLQYNKEAMESLTRMASGSSNEREEIHPTIDIQVSDDRCKSCHSRSGRISLNYEGWNELSVSKYEINDSLHFNMLPDKRLLEYIQDDIHHKKGLACIDCHNSYEIMGDGKHQIHKEEAVNIRCADCHPVGKPNSVVAGMLPDRESQMITWLRKYDPKGRILVTQKGRQPLLNTSIDSIGHITLVDKLNKKAHLSKPISLSCSKGKGHDRLSCGSCHTAWVPQCIGCHNTYEKGSSGFDLLTGKATKGTWVEYAGKNFAEPPVLGISENSENQVVTAMPGMIMTIDKESFESGKGKSFHRLYTSASGHTTQREGRSCKSCHNNPLAIGFGRGTLDYIISGKTGRWEFKPRFALNEIDSLPEDAWIGFLKEGKNPFSARKGLRPFTVREQKRILEAGSCLTCHDDKSMVMENALSNFEQTKKKCTIHCILPEW